MLYRNVVATSSLVLIAVCAAAQLPAADPQNTIKKYHDGGIRDIEAIGTRKIGCGRGLGNWYSLERQIAMGKDYSHQVESTSRLINDPLVTEYINRIGQNLVRNSDSQVPFTIKVIESVTFTSIPA
jgi:predicted Zn-dependent protease